MRNKINYFIFTTLICISSVTLQSIQAQDVVISIDSFKTILGKHTISSETVISLLLENPEIVNKVLKSYIQKDSRFLRDMNLEFKTFKSNDADSALGLGFSYSYEKDIKRTLIKEQSTNQTGISLSVRAQGNIAFDKKTNPNDFLDSDFSFHLFRSWGGTITTSDELRDKLNKLEDIMVNISDENELRSNPFAKEFTATVQKHLSSQFYSDFSLTGGLESNQDFSRRQYVYGAHLGFDFKPWSNGYWNVFDWPFAAIRWLSGYDEDLQPRGSTFPTVLFAIDRVVPKNDTLRQMVNAGSTFTRVSSELAFKTQLSNISYFEADFRYYRELKPLSEIKQANLEEHIYFTAALTSLNNVFISYTTGKLPIDAKDDQVYEIGFKFHF